MSADILARRAAYKRVDVEARKTKSSVAALEAELETVAPPRGFRNKLVSTHAARPERLALIAEIKKASPSKGLIREDFDPPSLARAYEAGGAACLSILTDTPSFQGADDHFHAAREAVALPCIRKEFLVDPWQVLESRLLGADAILVILAMVDDVLARALMDEARRLGMDALVEVHDETEMARACDLGADLVGVNNRDLRTFTVDLANTERLATLAPKDAVLVTESGIFTPQDVSRLAKSGANAMLVGESLMRQPDVALAVSALLA
jgi:indole-3-glycerol phosphate synthase